jgi:hypothetical protein
MTALTDAELANLVDAFYSESGVDLVGLWQIAKVVEEAVGVGAVAREQSLLIVRALLEKGLCAGDPPYRAGGYEPWQDQTASAVIDRIRSEWVALGRTPNIPDVVWFGRK